MAVTRVLIACLMTICTQYIELECLEVKGAAMQASPNFIYEFRFMRSVCLLYPLSLISLAVFYIRCLKVRLKSVFRSFIFFLKSSCFCFRAFYLSCISARLFIPTTAIPTSAPRKPPTSLVPSPAYNSFFPVRSLRVLTIYYFYEGVVLANMVM